MIILLLYYYGSSKTLQSINNLPRLQKALACVYRRVSENLVSSSVQSTSKIIDHFIKSVMVVF